MLPYVKTNKSTKARDIQILIVRNRFDPGIRFSSDYKLHVKLWVWSLGVRNRHLNNFQVIRCDRLFYDWLWTVSSSLISLMIWQSPGLPGWRKVNFITVTRRPHHPNIAAGLCCLATSSGFLPTLCEKWSGFFYMHRVFLSYTRDRRLKVSSERL